MPILRFIAISANLFTGVAELEKTTLGLSYQVRLSQRQSVELATGHKFDDLDGRVTVLARADDSHQEGQKVGDMRYFAAHDDVFYPFPTSYIIEVLMTAHQLHELVAAARLGRLPSQISVNVEGIEYDWQPDGSGKKWDNKTSPHLKVNRVHFDVPLVISASKGNFDDSPSEDSTCHPHAGN